MSAELVAMNYIVTIGGKALSLDRRECITSITHEENCDGADTLTLVIQDPKYLYIEDDIFVEDHKIGCKMNLVGDSTVIEFEGYISAIDPDFPEVGFPTITITCIDKTHLMNREKKTRSWTNKTRPEVVQIIAKEYGYTCVIESGYNFTKEETISQSDATDIEFIESMADEETDLFSVKLRGSTLYYVKKGLLAKSKAKLGYKVYPYNVMRFSPKINKETRQVEVKSSNISSSSKARISSSASSSNNTQGEAPKMKTKEGLEGYIYNSNTGKWIPSSPSKKTPKYPNIMTEELK